MRVFCRCILVIVAVLLPQLTTFGQCPANTGGCTWASTVSPDFLYKGCWVRVQYCYRTCNGICEVSLNSWTFYDKDCMAGQSIDADIWEISAMKILSSLIGTYSCFEYLPACPQTTSYHVMTRATCYQASTVGASGNELLLFPCVYNTGYCDATYSICYDNTKTPPELVVTKTTGSTVGTCPTTVSSGSIPIPGTIPNPFTSNCYTFCN